MRKLTFQESARQKKAALFLERNEAIEDIDEATTTILENISHIKQWIQGQVSCPREPNDQDDEDVVISLTSTNPQQVKKVANYDYNHRQFVSKSLREHTIVHLDLPSLIVHVDSQEGIEQRQRNKLKGYIRKHVMN